MPCRPRYTLLYDKCWQYLESVSRCMHVAVCAYMHGCWCGRGNTFQYIGWPGGSNCGVIVTIHAPAGPTVTGDRGDLCKLQAVVPHRPHGLRRLEGNSSPILGCLPSWCTALAFHPDRNFACYILEGIEHGFRVSFTHSISLRSAQSNMPSVYEHPDAIGKIRFTGSCMLGPFPLGSIHGSHVSRMGVVSSLAGGV